jgi:hypothetical protein
LLTIRWYDSVDRSMFVTTVVRPFGWLRNCDQ